MKMTNFKINYFCLSLNPNNKVKMKSISIVVSLILSVLTLTGQITPNLVAYYNFDANLSDAVGNSANLGMAVGTVNYDCGPLLESIALDGNNNEIQFGGSFAEAFNKNDFTLSLYFRPLSTSGTSQYLFSKSTMDCSGNKTLDIKYDPDLNAINVIMTENASKRVRLNSGLTSGDCWQHLVLVRKENVVKLYLNEKPVDEDATGTAIDLSDESDIFLGGSLCLVANSQRFKGYVDELKFFNRALDLREIQTLSLYPDQIATSDTLIFLGEQVPISMYKTCGNRVTWSPSVDLNSPVLLEPLITPKSAGFQTYTVQISDDRGDCIATDEIIINVVDPNTLDCGQGFIPSAFTPNGDGLNDQIGISNPYALSDFQELLITDRWGNTLFKTNNPFDQWDGFYKGVLMSPGVVTYQMRYTCQEEEIQQSGSITILY